MLKSKKTFAKAETDHRVSHSGLDEGQIATLTKKLKAAHENLKTIVETLGYMKPLVGPATKKQKVQKSQSTIEEVAADS